MTFTTSHEVRVTTTRPVAARKRSWSHPLSLLAFGCLILVVLKDNLFTSLREFAASNNPYEPPVAQRRINQTYFLDGDRVQNHSTRHLSLNSKQSQKYPPLSCTEIFHEDRNKPRPSGDPNDGAIHARYTSKKPYFWISLHKKEYDGTRWAILEYGEYYEIQETKAFANIIRRAANEGLLRRKSMKPSTPSTAPLEPLRVIDVGGNIGWYTFVVIAAAMELQYPIIVDVFEPNPRNHRRFCESLFLNEWLEHDKVAVNLYALGVTSTSMASDSSQIGRMAISNSGTGSLRAMNQENHTGTATFPLVSLDQMAKDADWMDGNQTISILKVDVEGFELEVIEGSQELLKTHAIQNIFFEGNLRSKLERSRFGRLVQIMIQNEYIAFRIGGFRGASTNVNTTWTTTMTAEQYTDSIRSECRTIGRQCNIWWRPVLSMDNNQQIKDN